MENIADAINSIMNRSYSTDEERIEAMTNYATRYISEYGIFDLPDNVTRLASALLLEKLAYEDANIITAEDVRELFNAYTEN